MKDIFMNAQILKNFLVPLLINDNLNFILHSWIIILFFQRSISIFSLPFSFQSCRLEVYANAFPFLLQCSHKFLIHANFKLTMGSLPFILYTNLYFLLCSSRQFLMEVFDLQLLPHKVVGKITKQRTQSIHRHFETILQELILLRYSLCLWNSVILLAVVVWRIGRSLVLKLQDFLQLRKALFYYSFNESSTVVPFSSHGIPCTCGP